MNVNEYIASGILEDYVLGLSTEQERREVECMSQIYPEIKAELTAFQLAMEQKTTAASVSPPVKLKAQIMAELEKLPKEAKVVSMQSEQIGRTKDQSSITKWLAAASIALLVGFVYLTNKTISLTTQVTDSTALIEKTNQENQEAITKLEESNRALSMELAMFRDPRFTNVFLTGVESRPQDLLTIVCWNKETNETLIAIENLPAAPKDKQYQLWAIIDGTPVDLGVFDTAGESTPFFPMKSIEQGTPQAFAITLEEHGGKPTPNLEELYVLGKL